MLLQRITTSDDLLADAPLGTGSILFWRFAAIAYEPAVRAIKRWAAKHADDWGLEWDRGAAAIVSWQPAAPGSALRVRKVGGRIDIAQANSDKPDHKQVLIRLITSDPLPEHQITAMRCRLALTLGPEIDAAEREAA